MLAKSQGIIRFSEEHPNKQVGRSSFPFEKWNDCLGIPPIWSVVVVLSLSCIISIVSIYTHIYITTTMRMHSLHQHLPLRSTYTSSALPPSFPFDLPIHQLSFPPSLPLVRRASLTVYKPLRPTVSSPYHSIVRPGKKGHALDSSTQEKEGGT